MEITTEQLKQAIENGYNVEILINGEYYNLKV